MDQKQNRAARRQALVDYVTGKGFYKVVGIGLAAVVTVAAVIGTAMRTRPSDPVPSGSVPLPASAASTASRITGSKPTGLSDQLVINPYSAAQAVVNSAVTETPADVPTSSAEEVLTQPLLFVMPVSGEIMTDYSDTQPIFSPTFGDWRVHAAVDIAGELGTPVRAAAQGTVTAIESDLMWGTTVVLTHADGYESRYCNLGAKPTVSVGTKVEVGQVIGSIGQTAQAEVGQQPHLHFALYLDGEPVDPQTVMAALGNE